MGNNNDLNERINDYNERASRHNENNLFDNSEANILDLNRYSLEKERRELEDEIAEKNRQIRLAQNLKEAEMSLDEVQSEKNRKEFLDAGLRGMMKYLPLIKLPENFENQRVYRLVSEACKRTKEFLDSQKKSHELLDEVIEAQSKAYHAMSKLKSQSILIKDKEAFNSAYEYFYLLLCATVQVKQHDTYASDATECYLKGFSFYPFYERLKLSYATDSEKSDGSMALFGWAFLILLAGFIFSKSWNNNPYAPSNDFSSVIYILCGFSIPVFFWRFWKRLGEVLRLKRIKSFNDDLQTAYKGLVYQIDNDLWISQRGENHSSRLENEDGIWLEPIDKSFLNRSISFIRRNIPLSTEEYSSYNNKKTFPKPSDAELRTIWKKIISTDKDFSTLQIMKERLFNIIGIVVILSLYVVANYYFGIYNHFITLFDDAGIFVGLVAVGFLLWLFYKIGDKIGGFAGSIIMIIVAIGLLIWADKRLTDEVMDPIIQWYRMAIPWVMPIGYLWYFSKSVAKYEKNNLSRKVKKLNAEIADILQI